jgi:gas vesicle protein
MMDTTAPASPGIVERLRHPGGTETWRQIMDEAADLIARLTAPTEGEETMGLIERLRDEARSWVIAAGAKGDEIDMQAKEGIEWVAADVIAALQARLTEAEQGDWMQRAADAEEQARRYGLEAEMLQATIERLSAPGPGEETTADERDVEESNIEDGLSFRARLLRDYAREKARADAAVDERNALMADFGNKQVEVDREKAARLAADKKWQAAEAECQEANDLLTEQEGTIERLQAALRDAGSIIDRLTYFTRIGISASLATVQIMHIDNAITEWRAALSPEPKP